jgi:CBS domain-containing protein
MNQSDLESLRTVRAEDVMQREVVSLPASTPISEAIRTFEEYHITGAPVIDGAGRAVGVLSVADIARGDHVRAGRLESERWDYYLASPLEEERDDLLSGDEYIFDKQDFSDETLGEQRAEDWMTPRVVSVDPSLDLPSLCKLMANEGIHRVLVTEEDSLIGIVSTFDVVRHLAKMA